jgi:hypothetical protein
VDPELLASLPAFEKILSLLLVHPGYMMRLYKVGGCWHPRRRPG